MGWTGGRGFTQQESALISLIRVICGLFRVQFENHWIPTVTYPNHLHLWYHGDQMRRGKGGYSHVCHNPGMYRAGGDAGRSD